MTDYLGGGFLFFSGFAWGCFWWEHWLAGAFVQALAFGLLARMAWEHRRDQESAALQRKFGDSN
jgi:protein-S-isoprenylcysteine O-methyltransferase Ste14